MTYRKFKKLIESLENVRWDESKGSIAVGDVSYPISIFIFKRKTKIPMISMTETQKRKVEYDGSKIQYLSREHNKSKKEI